MGHTLQPGTGVRLEPCRRWRLDENVHLLADIQGPAGLGEAVDCLQDTGVDALRAVAGERFFANDIGLEPHERQRGRRRLLPRSTASAFPPGCTRQASCSSM